MKLIKDWINTLYNYTDCALLFFLSIKVLLKKQVRSNNGPPVLTVKLSEKKQSNETSYMKQVNFVPEDVKGGVLWA